jgi:phosphoglycolate phosphatase
VAPLHVLYLFDIDGTLLHAHGTGRVAFESVFAELHGVASACDGMRFGGKTDPQLVEEVFAARLGRAPGSAEIEAFLEAYLGRLPALLEGHGVHVYDGVMSALEYLAAARGVMLAVATGNVQRGADAKLVAAGLARWFGFGGYGSDSRVRAELVARAIERGRERGPVREVVVVGDTVHDIAAARACGATVCAVTTGSDSAEQLAGADAVFGSLAELPPWHARRFG